MIESQQNSLKALQDFQEKCIDLATGKNVGYPIWEESRNQLLTFPNLIKKLPSWISQHRYGSKFWYFIKSKSPHYQPRREYIWSSLQPAFDFLEKGLSDPMAISLDEILRVCSIETISDCWEKINLRRGSDPEGAITLSRSLLESTCKYILSELKVEFKSSDDLSTLYKKISVAMQLGPELQSHKAFKEVLSGCFSIINGLASLRNSLGDAHGKTTNYQKPGKMHADLAINLAGSLSIFLIAIFDEKYKAVHPG